MNLGQTVKRYREEHEMTMEQFGKLFEPPASKSIVSRWEKTKSYPNHKRIKQISELMGVTVSELKQLDNGNEITISKSEYERLKAIEQKYHAIKALVTD